MSAHAHPANVEGGQNPHTEENTTDGERADMLTDYLELLVDEFGETPRLIPLDSEGKAPIIQGRCTLDSPEGRSYLVDGDEAVRQIREDGRRGFAIYAGKPEHNTEDLVLTDVDDRETFPYEDFPATLMVLSGSARGEHFTYRNGGDVSNASGKDGVDGEVRAQNWYCVTPGSIHPSGGVYHIYEERSIEMLHNQDVPTALRPASDRQDTDAEDYDPDPSADVKAVIRENTWIANYLAGVLEAPDRSTKDFAVCRAFISADVSEEDAYEVLSDSAATKVDAADAGRNYWSDTWTNAVAKEAENGDGVADTDRSDDGAISWDYVRGQYAEEGRQRGRYYAAQALEDRTAWMAVLEEDRLWVYDDDLGTYNSWGVPVANRMLEQGLDEFYSSTEKNEVIGRLEARNQVHREEINGGLHPRPLLCTGNCVVDLETGDTLDHNPEYKFTRGLKWDYNPENTDTEPVLEFLDDVTMRTEDRDTILDHLAHGLMPGHPYRAFVMMYGPGSNGKTQVGQLLRGFVGSDNAASVDLPEITGGDFATGALPGKFLNFGDENSVSEIRDATDLKSLTGGGTKRANEKFEKQFDFENEAAMFFAANEPPRISEEKEAIADRLYPIEMPYKFKGADEYDPDDPLHKRMVTGLADQLLENEAAMKGLLVLCVEHAKRLIETDGQYSMPEEPAERRLRYEAASDPIARFALQCFEPADHSDAVLKDDAYTVYKALCEADDERVTDEDTFKRMVTQQSGIDVESSRIRWLTPGKSRDRAWRYVRFSEDAAEYMSDRLRERYFPDGEWADGDTHGDAEGEDADQRDVFGAVPIANAAESLTGYVTVTVEVTTTERLGEDRNGVKAIVKDSSGAIDAVAWDEPLTSRLEDIEGECVAMKNVEVTEYEGTRQLSPIDGLTEIEHIQPGVGHTDGPARADGQAGLDGQRAQADGGQADIEGMQGRVLEHLRSQGRPKDIVPTAEIAGALNESPDAIESALDALAEKGRVIRHDDGVSLD